MPFALDSRPSVQPLWSKWSPWTPVLAGLAVLYIPTIVALADGVWLEESQGAIILLVVVWLVWRQRGTLRQPETPSAIATVAGTGALLIGLLTYVIGRSQSIILFEVSSALPVLAGVLLLSRGWLGLRAMWFPLLFFVFVIPLPDFFVAAVTGPLKSAVSNVVETLLYWAGYPIARSGVVLSIGSYQLLVADACSGLNSIFSLLALGLLYLYLVPARSLVRNMLVIASILPIAFAVNVLRVTILVLITYYFGDEAGQGFVHEFAGLVLFIGSLSLLLMTDIIARRMLGVRRGRADVQR